MADPAPARLAALRSLVDATGAALVTGPAGSGRTHLLEQFAESERAIGRAVWWCRGHQHSPATGDGPFAPGADPGATPADLGDLSGTVLVDDAHHLDDRLLALLTTLAEHRQAGATRLVVARRDHHPSPGLAALEAAVVGPQGAVRLGPLDAAEVVEVIELTRRSVARPTAPDVGHLLTATGGWADLVVAGLHGDGALDELVRSRMGLLRDDHLTCLMALAFDVPVGSPAFEPFTGADLAEADHAVTAGHAVGLLLDDPAPVPAVAAVLRRSAPQALLARLAGVVHRTEAPERSVVAGHLCDAGHRSAEATALYVAAAEQEAPADPRRALALYDLAVAGGADARALAEPRAWATIAAGEPAAALALLADHDATDGSALAPDAAGAAWARLGLPALAADAYQRGGLPHLAAAARAAGGVVDDGGAEPDLAAEGGVAVDGSAELATGMRAWVTGDHAQALTLLERSAALAGTHHRAHRWPDTPHGALAAALVHAYDPAALHRAEATLTEARLGGIGGTTAADRHALLGAWCALLAGRAEDAGQELHEVRSPAGRDALTAAALHAALALRSDDPGHLDPAWTVVDQAWPRAEVDAFGVLMAAEVAALAARTGHDPEAVLAPVTGLVERLGSPVTLGLPLAWGRLAVAVAADDAEAAGAAADALTRVAEVDERPAATVLAEAGATFAAVLAGDVEPDVVHATADRLAERGMLAEATRLLGAAGLRCRDAAATKALLARLRQLQAARVRTERGTTRVEVDLSEREQEVARAVLEGLTHKEIGALLFISAKTVEHHVAKIRQKLGATNRADLLAQIRQALDPAESTPGA